MEAIWSGEFCSLEIPSPDIWIRSVNDSRSVLTHQTWGDFKRTSKVFCRAEAAKALKKIRKRVRHSSWYILAQQRTSHVSQGSSKGRAVARAAWLWMRIWMRSGWPCLDQKEEVSVSFVPSCMFGTRWLYLLAWCPKLRCNVGIPEKPHWFLPFQWQRPNNNVGFVVFPFSMSSQDPLEDLVVATNPST